VIDQIDFSVNATQVLPSAGSAGPVNFAGGPFVVLPAFASDAMTVLSGFGNDVAVYETNADANNVDVRYTLTFRPFIAISNVNTKIHAAVMNRAGIPGGDEKDIAKNCTPDPLTCNWNQVAPVDLQAEECITINLEPHRDDKDEDRPTNQAAVKAFVENGGNFLAQCHAVANFEGLVGDPTPVGIFLTTDGIVKNGLDEILKYPSPTVPFSQFIGGLDGGQGGSIPDWTHDGGGFQGAPSVGGHLVAQNTTSTDTYQATGGKRFPDALGGNVFYLGGHEYKDNNNNSINGVRMALAAVFVPADRPQVCGFDFGAPELTMVKNATQSNFTGSGQTLNYTFDVTNTGTVAIPGPIVIFDDKATDESCPNVNTVGNFDTNLDPGETIQCTASYDTTGGDVTAGSVTNTATACGDPNTGSPVDEGDYDTCSDPDGETVPYLANDVVLVKTALDANYDAVGDQLDYTYDVTNNGQTKLNCPVTVSDNKVTVVCDACTGQGNNDNVLDPSETVQCDNTGDPYDVTQADLDAGSVTNQATATVDGVPSNQDEETVPAQQNPVLTLLKSVTESNYDQVGDTLNYSYKLTNDGNVTLYPPYSVNDNKATDESCPGTPASLAPGEYVTCSASYTVDQADLDNGSVTNQATASAKDPDDQTVNSNQDEETVPAVQNFSLTLLKTASPKQFSLEGDIINFTYKLTNSGNVTLWAPYTVDDDKSTDESCPATPDHIAPGEFVTCTATYQITANDVTNGSVTNLATATAKDASDAGDDVVSNQDSETVSNSGSLTRFIIHKIWDQAGDTDGIPVTGHLSCTGAFTTQQDVVFTATTDAILFVYDIALIPEEGQVDCTVTEVVPEGYHASYQCDEGNCGDSEQDLESCFWSDVDDDGTYRCTITNTPLPATVTVTKTWVIEGASQGFDGHHEIWGKCDENGYTDILLYGGSHNCFDGHCNAWAEVDDATDGSVDYEFTIVRPAYPSSDCTFYEETFDNVVESDNGCGDIQLSAGEEVECEIVNTVFFEGIPALNRYGLAMLALLMLGLGLVGFRRLT